MWPTSNRINKWCSSLILFDYSLISERNQERRRDEAISRVYFHRFGYKTTEHTPELFWPFWPQSDYLEVLQVSKLIFLTRCHLTNFSPDLRGFRSKILTCCSFTNFWCDKWLIFLGIRIRRISSGRFWLISEMWLFQFRWFRSQTPKSKCEKISTISTLGFIGCSAPKNAQDLSQFLVFRFLDHSGKLHLVNNHAGFSGI